MDTMMGHDPNPNSWVSEYIRIQRAQQRGAKVIVFDPRKSRWAEKADIHMLQTETYRTVLGHRSECPEGHS